MVGAIIAYVTISILRGCEMKRYIVTDAEGRAAGGRVISPGKFVRQNQAELLQQVSSCCAHSPDVAMMLGGADSGTARLFMVECFGVDTPAISYTVLKEMDPPHKPTPFQKLAFAVLTLSRAVRGREPIFIRWANDWLANKDRSAETAIRVAADLVRNATPQAAPFAAWSRDVAEAFEEEQDPWQPRLKLVLQAAAGSMRDAPPLTTEALMGMESWGVPLAEYCQAVLRSTAPA